MLITNIHQQDSKNYLAAQVHGQSVRYDQAILIKHFLLIFLIKLKSGQLYYQVNFNLVIYYSRWYPVVLIQYGIWDFQVKYGLEVQYFRYDELRWLDFQ